MLNPFASAVPSHLKLKNASLTLAAGSGSRF